jgi:hypothetical protein
MQLGGEGNERGGMGNQINAGLAGSQDLALSTTPKGIKWFIPDETDGLFST